MESNKDEALRCIDIASRFITEENYSQALKFLKKSLNLYPTEQAKALLSKVEGKHRPSGRSPSPPASPPRDSTSSRTQAPTVERSYTKEQHDAVIRVKKCKNYYEILEVSREVTDTELKKQYRKLALLMHPDKNHAPGAEEAFKAVSQAFACLSDVDKRRHYDLHGSESPAQNINSARYRTNMGDLTPEELFDMMFGNQFSRRYSYEVPRPRRQQQHYHEETVSSSALLSGFLQLMLFIIMLLLLTSQFGYQEPSFSLKKIGPYNLEKWTERRNVSYFVSKDTENKIRNGAVNLNSLESEVERTWVAEMERMCSFERQQKNRMVRMANWYEDGDEKIDMLKKAHSWKTPSCDALYS